MAPNSAKVCWVRKCKWIPQTYAHFVNNLRNPLTICGFRLQFAVSDSRQLKFVNTYIFIRSWVPQTVLIPHIYLWILQSCPFLGLFWAKQCFSYFPWNSNQQSRLKKTAIVCIPRKNWFCLRQNPLTIHKVHSLAGKVMINCHAKMWFVVFWQFLWRFFCFLWCLSKKNTWKKLVFLGSSWTKKNQLGFLLLLLSEATIFIFYL